MHVQASVNLEAPSRRDRTVRLQRARGPGTSRIAAFLDQLGKVGDPVIAEQAGVSCAAVSAYRRKHGIQAFERFTRAIEPSCRSPHCWAFGIVAVGAGTTREFVVVGADMRDALAQAVDALAEDGTWTVQSIRVLGEVLTRRESGRRQ